MENALFFVEDGKEVAFFVLMDTVVNETTYILASDTDPEDESVPDEDVECFILKKIQEDGDEIVYEPVEDDEEFDAVSKIFEELLDEEDISLN